MTVLLFVGLGYLLGLATAYCVYLIARTADEYPEVVYLSASIEGGITAPETERSPIDAIGP